MATSDLSRGLAPSVRIARGVLLGDRISFQDVSRVNTFLRTKHLKIITIHYQKSLAFRMVVGRTPIMSLDEVLDEEVFLAMLFPISCAPGDP